MPSSIPEILSRMLGEGAEVALVHPLLDGFLCVKPERSGPPVRFCVRRLVEQGFLTPDESRALLELLDPAALVETRS